MNFSSQCELIDFSISEPDSPSVGITESTVASITIYGRGVSTPSNSNFDLFSIISIYPDSDPPFNRTIAGSINTSENMTLSGLTAGTRYAIQVTTEVGTGGTLCSIPSTRVDSVAGTIHRCTGNLRIICELCMMKLFVVFAFLFNCVHGIDC